MIQIGKGDLEDLLKKTQRMCNINGKPMAQVIGCVIETIPVAGILCTTSIVRDGKTSVASFMTACDNCDEEVYIIPDIEKALGILKAHRGLVTLTRKEDKLVFSSVGKQTTISADPRALAFPHTKKSISLWNEESQERMSSILTGGAYQLASGEVRQPFATFELQAIDLREAIEAGNINGQKVNRCKLIWDGQELSLEVGNDLLGKTTTQLFISESMFEPFSLEFEGGLENCIGNGEIALHVLDFNSEDQGYSMIITSGKGKIFQRGVM